MKAYLFLFSAVFFLVASSCKKNNDAEPGNDNPGVQLIGTWDVDTMYTTIYYTNAADKVYTVFPNDDYAKITFKPDKIYQSEMFYMGMSNSNNGTYSVKKNKITIKPALDKEDAVLPVNTVNCNIQDSSKMTLTGSIMEDDLKTVYKVLLTKE